MGEEQHIQWTLIINLRECHQIVKKWIQERWNTPISYSLSFSFHLKLYSAHSCQYNKMWNIHKQKIINCVMVLVLVGSMLFTLLLCLLQLLLLVLPSLFNFFTGVSSVMEYCLNVNEHFFIVQMFECAEHVFVRLCVLLLFSYSFCLVSKYRWNTHALYFIY